MQVLINNVQVPFSGTLRLKYSNPIFNSVGSYSLPISFPARHPAVQKAFGYPSLIDSQIPLSVSGMIRSADIELIGEWQVNSADNSTIEAYFKSNTSVFYSLIAGKYLTDMTFGGIKTPISFDNVGLVLNLMSELAGAIYPETEYISYCAYMPNASSNDDIPDLRFVNPVDSEAPFDFIVPTSGREYLNQGIYLFVGAVLEYIFNEHGYQVEKNIFAEDFNLRHLTIFNTFNQAGWYEFDYRNWVPRRLISEFLEKLSVRFNLAITFNENSKRVKIDFFDSLIESIDETSLRIENRKIDPRTLTGVKLVAEQPDTWSKTNYQLITDYANKIFDVLSVATIEDIDGTQGMLVYVINEAAYYLIGSGSARIRLCSNQLPYIYGTNPIERQAVGSPSMYILEELVDETYTRKWLLPRCDLQLNGKKFTEWNTETPGYNDFPIMLVYSFALSYTWETSGDHASEMIHYPFAGTTIYDPAGVEISGMDMTLQWDGEIGIVSNCWKNRLYWELHTKKIVTGNILGNDIRKLFDFSKAKRIEKSNYLVNSFTLEFTASSYRIRDIELFRL